jgi:predicted nucleic acid-binding protein
VTEILLDTNVVSELLRKQPAQPVVAFIESCRDPIVSAVVFHELAYGVERLRDKIGKARLEDYLDRVRARFADRIVEINVSIAETSGRLRAAATRDGWVLSQMDSLIAASAMARSAQLATRNVSDFERLGISLIDPWSVR